MHFDTLILNLASDWRTNEVLLLRIAILCFRYGRILHFSSPGVGSPTASTSWPTPCQARGVVAASTLTTPQRPAAESATHRRPSNLGKVISCGRDTRAGRAASGERTHSPRRPPRQDRPVMYSLLIHSLTEGYRRWLRECDAVPNDVSGFYRVGRCVRKSWRTIGQWRPQASPRNPGYYCSKAQVVRHNPEQNISPD